MLRLRASAGRATGCAAPAAGCRPCARAAARAALPGTALGRPQLQLAGTRLAVRRGGPRQPRRGELAVRAAFFGVGAPEAVLVGVVALVVFGPKGLAQAVKSLGATLRSFSPTIRELASVTNELSSTLQEQIGLDDIRNEFRNPQPPYRLPPSEADASQAASTSKAQGEGKEGSTSSSKDKAAGKEQEGLAQESEDELAAKIAESKRLAWGGAAPEPTAAGSAQQQQPAAAEAGAAAAVGNGSKATAATEPAPKAEAAPKAASKPAGKSAAADMSLEELEAELARRRQAGGSGGSK